MSDKQITFVVSPYSALAEAASGLSAGQWGTFTLDGVFDPDPFDAGDTVFSWGERLLWDPVNRLAQFFGGVHGTGGAETMWVNTYREATNDFGTRLHWPADSDTNEHAYFNLALDTANGNLYGHNAFGDSTNIHIYNWATQQFGSDWGVPSYAGVFRYDPLEWHPNLSGGSLVTADHWGVAYRPRGAGSWTNIATAPPQIAADSYTFSAYNARDDAVYFAGYEKDDPSPVNIMFKITNTGTKVARTSPAKLFGYRDGDTGGANCAIYPSGNPANKLLAISSDGEIQEYDDATDTWSGVISNVPSALLGSAGDATWCIGACPTYNCMIAFKLASITTVSTEAHIWKR